MFFFVVLHKHVCFVPMKWDEKFRRWLLVREWISVKGSSKGREVVQTLCGETVSDEDAVTEQLPNMYLCSKCDSASNRKRNRAASFVRKLPRSNLKKIPRYEHLPGRGGIHLTHK